MLEESHNTSDLSAPIVTLTSHMVESDERMCQLEVDNSAMQIENLELQGRVKHLTTGMTTLPWFPHVQLRTHVSSMTMLGSNTPIRDTVIREQSRKKSTLVDDIDVATPKRGSGPTPNNGNGPNPPPVDNNFVRRGITTKRTYNSTTLGDLRGGCRFAKMEDMIK